MQYSKKHPNRLPCLCRILSICILITLFFLQTGCKKDDTLNKLKSVADQSNVTIQGIVNFNKDVDEITAKEILQNLFLKYIDVDFSVENAKGKFIGGIDSTTHPRIDIYVKGSNIQEDDDYFRFKQFCKEWSYYYKIYCEPVRILNEDNRPYERISLRELLKIDIKKMKGVSTLAKRDHIDQVMVDLFLFDRLGKHHMHKFVEFD